MALVTCPECGREISDQAASCPGCGSPIATRPAAATSASSGGPSSGWYLDPSSEHTSRYWDGSVWTDRTSDAQRKISPERRKELLAQSIANQLSAPGKWRVESQTDYYAIVVGGKPVNHILHVILTVLTVGFWVFVWILMALAGGEKRYKITIDEYGNGTNQKLG